jgi:transaldolase
MSWNLDRVVDLITKNKKNKKKQQQQQQQQQQKVVESSRKHTQFEEREEKWVQYKQQSGIAEFTISWIGLVAEKATKI